MLISTTAVAGTPFRVFKGLFFYAMKMYALTNQHECKAVAWSASAWQPSPVADQKMTFLLIGQSCSMDVLYKIFFRVRVSSFKYPELVP